MGMAWLRVCAAGLFGCALALSGCGREVLLALHARTLGDGRDAGQGDAGARDGGSVAPAQDAGAMPRDAGTLDAAVPAPDAAVDSGRIDGGQAQADAGDPGRTAVESLRARYDFEGTGTVVFDRIGAADGRALGGAELAGDGTLTLDGDDDFVDLPNGLISDLQSATVMAWVQWFGGVCWQRIFDFGSSDQGEGMVGNVVSSVFVTPLVCGRGGAAAYIELGSAQYSVFLDASLPVDRWISIALTLDPPGDRMRLYVDGELRAEAPAPFALDLIQDENVWLGRSQWVQDRNLAGRYEEFRIYDRALSASEIRAAHERGPDEP